MSAKFSCLGNNPTHKGRVNVRSAFMQPTGTESAPTWVVQLYSLTLQRLRDVCECLQILLGCELSPR